MAFDERIRNIIIPRELQLVKVNVGIFKDCKFYLKMDHKCNIANFHLGFSFYNYILCYKLINYIYVDEL